MNPIDDQLNRLFRSAQGAKAPEIAAPFGLETRVLAAWREAAKAPAAFWEMGVLTRGLVLAGVIMAACFLPALTSTPAGYTSIADDVQSTDSAVDADAYP